MSVSLFHTENLTTPGVERIPLYLLWFGLASGCRAPDPDAPPPPAPDPMGPPATPEETPVAPRRFDALLDVRFLIP